MKNDGGSAFPRYEYNPHYCQMQPVNGMSLRDYFAGQALAGNLIPDAEVQSVERITHECYQMADAMLAEREKKQ